MIVFIFPFFNFTSKREFDLILGFEENDLKSYINTGHFDNGIGIFVTIVDSKNNIQEFTLINEATKNQQKLLKYIFNYAIQNSNFNKKQLSLLLK